MKKVCFLLWMMLATTISAMAQYNFEAIKDEQTGQTMFWGRCTFDDLTDESSFDWLRINSNNYTPDAGITEQLKKILPTCQIYIFMGTWCEDTQNLLPKLYKTMLLSRCYTNYKMYGLDRQKQSKDNEQERFKVLNVPTIIIMKDEKELGRIVETVSTNIETELLKIVQKS